MKKHLLVLSLIATSGLTAEKSKTQTAQKSTSCIDCECYTPQYYDLQCACGYLIDVEFLYWYGKENDLSAGLKMRTKGIDVAIPSSSISTGIIVPQEHTNMQSRWKPGFRVGVGYQELCDGWDVYVSYTYYHNKNKESLSVDPLTSLPPSLNSKSLISFWVNPLVDSLVTNVLVGFQTIDTKWRLNYHMFDAELGRKFWLSKCFNFRPFFGLRGGWTRIDYNTDQFVEVEDGSKSFCEFHDNFRNRFWGVGLLGGVQPTWHFTNRFAIYGLVDFALLWGEFDTWRKEKFFYQENVQLPIVNGSYRSDNDLDGMQGVFDLGIGIRWVDTWCSDRYRTTIEAGWENHIWYHHVPRLQLCDTYDNGDFRNRIIGFTEFSQNETDLVFGGLVVRARFDF